MHIYLLDASRHCPPNHLDYYRDFRVFDSIDAAKAAVQAYTAEPIEWHGSDDFSGAFYDDNNWPDVQIWRVPVETAEGRPN